jgi:hypothetical protein
LDEVKPSQTKFRRLGRVKVLAALAGGSAVVAMGVLSVVGSSDGSGVGLTSKGPPAMSTGATSTITYSAGLATPAAAPTLKATYNGELEP